LSVIDLGNATKLKTYSNLLSNYENDLITGKNSFNFQINNSHLDIKDNTNKMIYKKVEQIKISIDELTKLIENISNEANQLSTTISTTISII
jgi:archaellum component FlaC